MIGALALAGVLAAGAAPDAIDTGERVTAAAAAEQGLQGPLDGGWTLNDAAGRPLYRLEFADPAGGCGPLVGAWRDMGMRAGMIGVARRDGRRLRLQFAAPMSASATLSLTEQSPDRWTGSMVADGARRVVVLRRDRSGMNSD